MHKGPTAWVSTAPILPMHRLTLIPVLAVAFAAFGPTPAVAQPADLLLPEQASAVASRSAAPAQHEKKFAQRARKARVNAAALEAESIRLALFDDIQPILERESLDRPDDDTVVWVGRGRVGRPGRPHLVEGRPVWHRLRRPSHVRDHDGSGR